jgi:hypothetical protein
MAWHYEQSGKAVGPVSPEQFDELVHAGTIAPDTLVWQEGMANWQPYRTLQPAPPAPATTAPLLPGGVMCAECGRSFPQSEVISYEKFWVCAACKPVFFQKIREGLRPSGAPIWRSDKTLVITGEATLPDRCVKCNAPAEGRRLKRRLYWHHPAVYLLILCSILIYVIVALIIRKRATIEIGLCERHLAKRKRDILIGWAMALSGLGLLIGGISANSGWAGAAGGVVFLAALFYGVATAQMVSAKRIDDAHVWVRGVCPEYLDTLPDWSGD